MFRASSGAVIVSALLAFSVMSCAENPAKPPKAPVASVARTPAVSPAPTHARARSEAAPLPETASVADVAASVTPSVVNVFTQRTVAAPPEPAPSFHDPFFQFFFNRPEQPKLEGKPKGWQERSLGSGVIVSPDGVIVTNDHVVDHADEIRVGLKDGRELDAKIVGTDPKTDLAVLRVKAENLPAIRIADSSKTRVGDPVLAIGNPFGIGQTVTMGIISAVGRANVGIADYEDFIQTDAAINPGNSGGALVNLRGELIGINTALASRTGGYQGIGFAIPSNMALQIESELLAHGKVSRGWLGVGIQDLSGDLAKAIGDKPRSGVLVSDVEKGSPAAKAGIRRGDVITAVDGTPMHDTGHVRNTIAALGVGKKAEIHLMRDGKAIAVETTLAELPSDKTAAHTSSVGGNRLGLLSGVVVAPLDAAARGRLHVGNDVAGVVVTGVGADSAASEMGLAVDDVIVEVNHRRVTAPKEFESAAKSAGRQVLLLVYRNGTTLYLAFAH
jgi:serine protease Do